HLVLAAAAAVEPAPQAAEHGLGSLFLTETHMTQRHIATATVRQRNLVPTALALANLDECLVDQAGGNRTARGLVQGSIAVDAAALCEGRRRCQQQQQRRDQFFHCPTLLPVTAARPTGSLPPALRQRYTRGRFRGASRVPPPPAVPC